MLCPVCNAWSEVKSTRDAVRRRRECANGHRFTTVEVLIADAPSCESSEPIAIIARDEVTGEAVHTFSSIRQARRAGFRDVNISECISGTRGTYKGFVWTRL